MHTFKVHTNNAQSSAKYPYVIDVQAPILDELSTRMVIPLVSKKLFGDAGMKLLNPEITIKNIEYLILAQQLTAVPKEYLGDVVEGTKVDREKLLSAIDFLITGY